jgi:hypothetical protein
MMRINYYKSEDTLINKGKNMKKEHQKTLKLL